MENPDNGSVEEGVTQQKQETLLRFRVGPFRFSVPAVEVEGIIVPPVLTTIPLTPPHSKGVFMYRERLASAISLRSKFGLPDNDDENLGQLIIGEVSMGLAGFWVDEVYETTESTEIEWRPMPDFVPHAAFESFGVHEDEIVMATTMQKLYDVPAEQMALMLASMRMNYDLPEDVPPVAAEEMSGADTAGDEDAFGDLVDTAQTELETTSKQNEAPQTSSIKAETQPANVIEFPKAQEANTDNKSGVASDANQKTTTSTSLFDRSKHGSNSSASRVGTTPRTPSENVSGASRISGNTRDAGDYAARRQAQSTNRGRGYQASRSGAYSGGTFAGSVNRFQQHDSSVHPENKIEPEVQERNRSGIGWLVILLLLLIAALIYWLWPNAKPVKRYESPATTSVSSREATETTGSTQSGPTDSSIGVQHKTSEPVVPAESVTPAHEDAKAPDSTSGEVYRLEGKDVTVTVERNLNEQAVTGKPASETANSSDDNQSMAQPGYHEFVHIVVKGDTLWDIAKHYLKNPFRYPELAKLSEIKNPDLIYPGDTVRIRTRDDSSSN